MDDHAAPSRWPLPRPGRPDVRFLVLAHVPIALAAMLYTPAVRLLARRLGVPAAQVPGLTDLLGGWRGGLWVAFFFLLGYGYLGLVVNPLRRRLRRARGEPVSTVGLPGGLTTRLVGILLVYVLLGLFMDGFVLFKALIPRIVPFGWDPALHRLDTLVHFGVTPWRISHASFGGVLATRVLDLAYAAWIPVSVAGVALVAWSLDLEWRTRFFVSYVACWLVLGTGLALLLSSAGPCYFDRVMGEDVYGELMGRLGGIDGVAALTSLDLQETLWASYATGRVAGFAGISAMPSLHVAIAVLMALAFGERNRVLGIALGIFATLVFVATVHLGWHYALDGYVAAAGAVLIWWGAGRALKGTPLATLDPATMDSTRPPE